MKHAQLLLLVGLAAFLSGCASGARMENMIYAGPETEQKVFAETLEEQVEVSTVSGGKKTNPAWASAIGNEEFAGAIRQSLAEQGLLSETGRYLLTVELLKVDQPLAGFDMKVTTYVQYALKDSESGEEVLNKTIKAPYTATVGDAFAGAKRLRLANEGSAKKNIEMLLDELSKLQIDPEQVSLTDT